MKLVTASAFALCTPPLLACASTASAPAARAELMRADAAFSALSVERGAAEAFRQYLADDATEIQNGGDFVHGKAAIAGGLVPSAGKSFTLRWEPVQADASSSGDLGITYGRFTLEVSGGDAPPKKHTGKYMTVWRRQADGSWKVSVDMGNADATP